MSCSAVGSMTPPACSAVGSTIPPSGVISAVGVIPGAVGCTGGTSVLTPPCGASNVPGCEPPDYAGRGVLRRRLLRACLAATGRALILSLEPGASHAVLTVNLRHNRRVPADVRVILPSKVAISGLQLLERAYALKIVYTIFAHKAIQILKGEVAAVAVARDGARAALHPLDNPRAHARRAGRRRPRPQNCRRIPRRL